MDCHIVFDQEQVIWVFGGPGTTSQQITQGSLDFIAKEWQSLMQHRLCPTQRDIVLTTGRVDLVASIIAGYEFDVALFVAREIWNQWEKLR